MKTIDNDIKTGQFKQIYLLYGEEQYLIRQYRDKLKHALAADDDTMNFSAFSGSDINQKEIIDLAETLPFFADRRLILIEDSGLFKKSAEELADYMSSIPETTYFVFAEKEIDKKTKMYKQVKKNGSIVEFPRQNETTLSRWIEGRIRRNGKILQEMPMRSLSVKPAMTWKISTKSWKNFSATHWKKTILMSPMWKPSPPNRPRIKSLT